MKKARQRLHAPGHEPKDLALTATKDSEAEVGQAWREGWRNVKGARVIVLTDVGPSYIRARSQCPPHRRTCMRRARLESDFTLIGSMIMHEPKFWPAWFREDVSPEPTP